MERNIPTITINNPNRPINISMPNTGGGRGNPFVNWTGSTSNFGNTGNPTTNISTFNPPNINIPNNIPTGNTQSFGNNVDQNSTQVITRYQNLMKGFTGQVLGGANHDKRHCRDYSEKPQVNKEMLAAVRMIDSKNNPKAVNFILFHDCYLNDDDMYWLTSVFNTHKSNIAVNTIDLSNNCISLTPTKNMPFFSFNYPFYTTWNVLRLDLSNNNVGDDGAKCIADGLAKGFFPLTKKINLSGNKITSNGESFIVKAIQSSTVQDIIVLTQRLSDNCKLLPFPGIATKEEKIDELRKFIQLGKEKGTYDEAVVVDKSFWGEIKNAATGLLTVKSASVGFSKCHFVPEDMATGYAQDKIVAKLPKLANGMYKYATKLLSVKDIVTCYLGATDEAWSSEPGLSVVKHDLCVMGEQEFCGDQ